MGKRYTKRQRIEAARVCSVMASTPGALGHFGYLHATAWLGYTGEVADLAVDAFRAAVCDHAEAEAMLRTGWTP